jgi:hypothetical protein
MESAPPASLPVRSSRRKPLRGSPNVSFRGRCGNLRWWRHLHLAALCAIDCRHLSQPDECHIGDTTCQPLNGTID